MCIRASNKPNNQQDLSLDEALFTLYLLQLQYSIIHYHYHHRRRRRHRRHRRHHHLKIIITKQYYHDKVSSRSSCGSVTHRCINTTGVW